MNFTVTCSATCSIKQSLKQNIRQNIPWAQGGGCRMVLILKEVGISQKSWQICCYFLHNLWCFRHVLMRFRNTKLINIDRETSFSSMERDCILQLYSFIHVNCIAICSSVSFTGETVQSCSSICYQSTLFCHLYFLADEIFKIAWCSEGAKQRDFKGLWAKMMSRQ